MIKKDCALSNFQQIQTKLIELTKEIRWRRKK
jgi:hypothetical protein